MDGAVEMAPLGIFCGLTGLHKRALFQQIFIHVSIYMYKYMHMYMYMYIHIFFSFSCSVQALTRTQSFAIEGRRPRPKGQRDGRE